MPSRRDALRACGATLTLSVAGCLSSDIDRTGTDGSVDDSTTDSTADPTTSPPPPEAREVSVGDVERGVPMTLPDIRWPDVAVPRVRGRRGAVRFGRRLAHPLGRERHRRDPNGRVRVDYE
jgi:hypothetical protein